MPSTIYSGLGNTPAALVKPAPFSSGAGMSDSGVTAIYSLTTLPPRSSFKPTPPHSTWIIKRIPNVGARYITTLSSIIPRIARSKLSPAASSDYAQLPTTQTSPSAALHPTNTSNLPTSPVPFALSPGTLVYTQQATPLTASPPIPFELAAPWLSNWLAMTASLSKKWVAGPQIRSLCTFIHKLHVFPPDSLPTWHCLECFPTSEVTDTRFQVSTGSLGAGPCST